MIKIPDGATVEDILGETVILSGQDWLYKRLVLRYAIQMESGIFPWAVYHQQQRMAVEVGTNGKVLTQRHHRFVAARLAKIKIPFEITTYTDLVDAGLAVPFMYAWADARWK